MFGIVLIIVLILLLIWFINTYNKLIATKMKVREAFSTMDVYLKKRFDLIPSLVETVKGYMGYENETLTKIVELRNNMVSNNRDKIDNENGISNAVKNLFAIAENYPELKADSQFLELQKQLQSIENDIEKSRRYYNGTVTNLNTMVNMIPTNIVASISKIKEEPFFEVSDATQRENIQLNINN